MSEGPEVEDQRRLLLAKLRTTDLAAYEMSLNARMMEVQIPLAVDAMEIAELERAIRTALKDSEQMRASARVLRKALDALPPPAQ